MKKALLSFCVSVLCAINLNAQNLITANKIASYTQAEITASINLIVENGVDVYYVQYNTIDVQGNPTIASGAIFIPTINCSNFPLIAYQHGTIFKREEVPSRGNDLGGLIFAAYGYVTTSADFLGLGDNPGFHPYMHGESEATAAIDMMRASRTYIADSLTTIGLNGEVYITGYSQGGHGAMALHKYIQENNLYSEFDVKFSAPLSGPYNISGVQSALSPDSTYASPSYYPYILKSYQMVYGNIYTSPSEIFKPPYDATILPLLDGQHSSVDINALLPNNIYAFMQDSFLNTFLADTINFSTPFRQALQQNDNHNWVPNRPVRMAYCDGDEQVFYQNALVAKDSMLTLGAIDVDAVHVFPGLDHWNCVLPSFLSAISWFDGVSTSCNTVSTHRVDLSQKVNIYPNPTSDWLNVDVTALENEKILQVKVFDLNGQEMMNTTKKTVNNLRLNVKNLSRGIYFIHLSNEDIVIHKKFIISQK